MRTPSRPSRIRNDHFYATVPMHCPYPINGDVEAKRASRLCLIASSEEDVPVYVTSYDKTTIG